MHIVETFSGVESESKISFGPGCIMRKFDQAQVYLSGTDYFLVTHQGDKRGYYRVEKDGDRWRYEGGALSLSYAHAEGLEPL